ncbi:MAG: DUF4058 family protein [Chloroflexi bacterium]|nr:DUF4058 family protein [Chloroflexota bacterium]
MQAAFEEMFRRAHYAEVMDYSGDVPPPRLRPADARWVQEQLHAWRAKQRQPGQ